jgi:hypothetical protein
MRKCIAEGLVAVSGVGGYSGRQGWEEHSERGEAISFQCKLDIRNMLILKHHLGFDIKCAR